MVVVALALGHRLPWQALWVPVRAVSPGGLLGRFAPRLASASKKESAMTQRHPFSEATLTRAPGRVWAFLLALRYPQIWRKLNDNGLSVAMIAEANALLDEVKLASLHQAPLGEAPVVEREAAVKACASLDESWLVKYPPLAQRISWASAEWLFADLTPQVGLAESVAVVETMLSRLDAIEAGRAPDEVDPKVLATLAASGLDKAERQRVAALTAAARGAATLPTTTGPATPPVSEVIFGQLQEALHLWWRAASGIARTANLKKIELMRLGLASPTKAKRPRDEAATPPSTATPS